MSDFDRFTERPPDPVEPSSTVSQSPEPGADSHNASPFEIGTQDHSDSVTPTQAPEAEDARHTQAEALHQEVKAREASVDARIEQLIAEIRGLALEPRDAGEPLHAHKGPLDDIRRYCQGVIGAIGGFFSAVFGHAEPTLDRPDARTAELAKKIGIDVEELKSLQETRRAYEELDRRIGNLENTATPEQQQTIAHTAETLDLHSRTKEWLESLVRSLENRAAPADSSGGVGPVEPNGPISPISPIRPIGPGTWDHTNPDASGGVGPGTPAAESPVVIPPWRSPLLPADHQVPGSPDSAATPWRPANSTHTETPYELPQPATHPDITPWRPAQHDTPLHPPDFSRWLPPTDPAHHDVPSIAPVNPTPWRETTPVVPEHRAGLPEGTIVIGDQNEAQDDELVHPQGLNDYHDVGTCGVVTQEMILNRLSGTHNFTERTLTNEAQAHGWFIPGAGSPLNRVGNLCEAHGLHVEHKTSSLQDLAEHLAKGDQAIVAVNAGKLGGAWALDPHSYGDGGPNHAVWVSGIKVETHNGISTVVSVKIHDSGVGKSYELSAEQFQQAWSASNGSAVYVSPGIVSRGAQTQ
jgi:hypothetical protein